MVRICRRMGFAAGAVALVASSVTPATSASVSGGISLELHRVPDRGQRTETYQRRRLHGPGEGFEVVPLNPGMGTHYAWVYAGTPPQRASVITDTGSSIMAFPCSGCDGCGTHTDQPFSTLKSSTLTHVTCSNPSFFRCQGCGGIKDKDKTTCDISQAYMEGSSWHATVVEDIVYLGGEASGNDTSMRSTYGTHFKFGCQSSETGLFISQVADGIMGLANNDNHIVAKLYREKKIPNKLFTLCFAPEGGAMSIGVPDTSRHKGNITYAKLKESSGFYGVELRDVRIAGTSIEPSPTSLSFGQYIVDSGTTDSYLPSSMRKKFQEAFKKFSGMDYHTSSSACLGYTDKDLKKLPNVEFILGAEDGGNLTLVVPPQQYLLREESGKYCSSIFLSEGSGGVIGANIMMDHDVIFDQGNQRVGFVEADCQYRRLPATNTTNSTTNVAVETNTPAATQAKSTHAPTEEPAPTKDLPSLSPVSPTPAPSSATPKPTKPTSAPTEAPTTAPTPEPTPEPTKATWPPTVTSAAAVKTPEPTKPVAVSDSSAKNSALNSSNAGEDDHPVVLTIVGTALAVAFIVIAAFSLRRRKKNKRDQKWSRVNETEGDDDDDEDDEEELIVHTSGQKSKAKKAPGRSDELDEDDDDDDDSDDNNIRRDDRLSSNDDDDDDDDDEIFDRDVEEGIKHSHDAKVLERL